ncbi:hypothetical protein ABID22_001324 [Pontibacter aydingkolensis]
MLTISAMQLKRGVLILVFSTVAMFTLAMIGYFGHHYKFSAVTILYFLLTLYFLGRLQLYRKKYG